MSENVSQWQWSDRLQQYYFHDNIANTYILRNGTRIPVPGGRAAAPTSTSTLTQSGPRSYPQANPGGYPAPSGYEQYPSGSVDYTYGPGAPGIQLVQNLGRLSLGFNFGSTNTTGSPYTTGSLGSAVPYQNLQETRDLNGVASRIADGPQGSRVLLGTAGDQEQLDAGTSLGPPCEIDLLMITDYKKRAEPRKFFKVGKVFLTLWSEPSAGFATDVTRVRFNQYVHTKIRRFVVIREGANYCVAVPIITYGGQGVAKRGVTKAEHAIIYTGRQSPQPDSAELPGRGERGMLSILIRVDPAEKDDSLWLDPMSRVNFGKAYTIEHNLKVKPLGMVGSVANLMDGVARVREQTPTLNVPISPVGGSGGSRPAPGSSRAGQRSGGARSADPDISSQAVQRARAIQQQRATQRGRANQLSNESESEESSEDDDDDDNDDNNEGAA